MIQIEELERRITALENRLTPAETHSEPKPLLSDAQVGWIARVKDVTAKVIRLVNITENHYLFSNGLTYNVHGDVVMGGLAFHETANSIISCEPLATERTAEWMKQMLLLGNKVTNIRWKYTPNLKYSFIENGIVKCNPEYPVAGILSPLTLKDGWQIYEPEPKEPQQQINSSSEPGVHQVIFAEPAPRLKVGDWATDGVVTGKVTSVNGNIANVKTPNAIYALNTENLKPIPKSEVNVTLTLEGTARKCAATNGMGFEVFDADGSVIAWVSFASVPRPSRSGAGTGGGKMKAIKMTKDQYLEKHKELVRELTETKGD